MLDHSDQPFYWVKAETLVKISKQNQNIYLKASGPRREQIFYRIYAFQTEVPCFQGGYRIFCNNVIYMVLLLFWHLFQSNCLNTLFFFFGKMWIITYVEKVKNSVIIFYVHLSFEYYLLLSLHLFFTLLYNSSKY